MNTRVDSLLPRGSKRIAAFAAAFALLALAAYEPLQYMARVWSGREEYSHGPLIPLIAAFLIWQRYPLWSAEPVRPSWSGVGLFLAGGCLILIGEISALFVVAQYGFVLALIGIVLAGAGRRVFRHCAVPLLLLFLMVPLPDFILNNLSADLQLLSSRFGVWMMRLMGITVYLEGNVIDLGAYRLEVAEACSGLRYLFPLMTLGFLIAYLFKAALWQRAIIFLSSIPITIVMNSVRVAMIGVMVEHWGTGAAEGFVHAFQGWAVFMVSAAIMFAEIVVLARVAGGGRSWRQLFGFERFEPSGSMRTSMSQGIPAQLWTAIIVTAGIAALAFGLPSRAEMIPQRERFSEFPRELGSWQGTRQTLDPGYQRVLQLDDYLLMDFAHRESYPVDLYIAWYDSQRAGRSAHSPRSCLPGGGWEIKSFERVAVPGVTRDKATLHVNRALIGLGNQRQIVYYWFEQRGRIVTNEYVVKWYLFWDSLVRDRTDGALVRVSVPIGRTTSEAAAESELKAFLQRLTPRLDAFIPS